MSTIGTPERYCTDLVTDAVAEAAVVGIHDELTGQAVNAFVALKEGNGSTEQTKKDLILQVRKSIGPFAAPKAVFVVSDLPKTRSGKIMRRILRKILAGEEDQLGDTSTVRLLSNCNPFRWPSSLNARLRMIRLFTNAWRTAVRPVGG